MKEMVLLWTKNVHFSYNQDIYIQKKGAAMGSPFGPVLARIFMVNLERSLVPKLNVFLNFWRRYMDNMITFIKIGYVENFVICLKFTYEMEVDKSSHPEVFCKKGALKNFEKFTRKNLYQSLFFNNIVGLRPTTLLKKRFWQRCFPANFTKFLDNTFFYRPSLVVASEVESKLAFLDILLQRDGHDIITTVYRKVANSDVYLDWYSFGPREWEQGTLRSLAQRAYIICSSSHHIYCSSSHLATQNHY